jgi:hypothetical protein
MARRAHQGEGGILGGTIPALGRAGAATAGEGAQETEGEDRAGPDHVDLIAATGGRRFIISLVYPGQIRDAPP